ncbi:MAG: HPr family phosphocarrier protein [Gammaproteobacteria bacterium]|nr:HPr family phosphocarrier protein [Gammaproteobacteria bacterium]NNF67857.1 HPr family phosphocarrier protein [Gammaproteobacteria bacterium]
MLEFDVTVRNRRGLHARPAARVVAMASEFDSDVRLIYQNRKVDGKSMLGLLVLAAPHGANVRVQLDGPDEKNAEYKLQALFNSLTTKTSTPISAE